MFFGWVRRNKGVTQLIRTFRDLQFSGVNLLIAGRVNKTTLADELKAESYGEPNIHLHLAFVEYHDVQLYMNAADVGVFPYEDVLTSGAVLLAMSFGKPCIAVRMGCIEEVLNELGAFVYKPEDPGGLRRCLLAAREAGANRLREMGAYNRATAERWDGTASRAQR